MRSSIRHEYAHAKLHQGSGGYLDGEGMVRKEIEADLLAFGKCSKLQYIMSALVSRFRFSRRDAYLTVERVAQEIKDMGFNAITPSQILDEINNVFSIIQIGLSAFGIIALVVAAIGIINTLIMAIYERTREIGVMKAVGATKGTIRLLFTIEGGALGFLGGVIGVGLGFILGQMLNFIGSRTFLSDFPTFQISVFSPWLILGIIGLTTAISLLAGLYPANRAARLDPVEALRYE